MKTAAIIITVWLIFVKVKGDYNINDIVIPKNCTKLLTEMRPKYVPYQEVYTTRNWLGFNRQRTRTNYKLELQNVITEINICCAGYEEYNAIACIPKCRKNCGINGICIRPETCKCNTGYHMNLISEECEASCSEPCVGGQCISPNFCRCKEGFIQINNATCVPICLSCEANEFCAGSLGCICKDGYTRDPVVQFKNGLHDGSTNGKCVPICENCLNGDCVSAHECKCHDGYRLVHDFCEPICDEGCVKGNCIAPQVCQCFHGYTFREGSNFTCEAVCNNTCINAICTSPNECTCHDGYVKKNSTEDNECIVICNCENGYCNETSSMCDTCMEGYNLTVVDNSSLCLAHCVGGCENGRCIEPQICECNEYYFSDKDFEENPICVHTCGAECAHGTCIEQTGTCRCNYGWVGKYCENPVLCAVIVPENHHIYLKMNETTLYDESENVTALEESWAGPICNNQCLYIINNMRNCVSLFIEEQFKPICLINIVSQCNLHSFNQSNKYETTVNTLLFITSTIIVLLLIGTAVYVLRFDRRNREKSIELQKSPQLIQNNDLEHLNINEYDGVSL